MEPLPAILRCPVGDEEWPATSFKAVVDATHEIQRPGTIHLSCPAGHSFTLAKAVRAKMFTRGQAKRLVAIAQGFADRFNAAKSFEEIEQVIREARGDRER